MKDNPLISIIVPVYNAEKYLHKCIKSIVNQTYTNIEILLIDDGSTDSSSNVCDYIASLDDRIIVIHKSNGGVSSARNIGLDKAKGDYISFVDADDYIDSNMYEVMLAEMINNNADIGVCGKKEYENGCLIITKILSGTEKLVNAEKGLHLLLARNEFDPGVCNKLFKSNVLKHLRFPVDRKISEELVFVFDAINISSTIVYINEVFYNVNIGNESATRTKFNPKFFDSLAAYDEVIDRCKNKHPKMRKQAEIGKIVVGMSIIMRIILDSSEDYIYQAKQLRKILLLNFWKYIFYREMSGKHRIKYIALKFSYSLYAILMRVYYGKFI